MGLVVVGVMRELVLEGWWSKRDVGGDVMVIR